MIFRKDINSLRGIAVLLVVLYHFKIEGFNAGFIGVDVFFVVSGFLMTKIIYEKMVTQKFSLFNFYIDRVYRIVPALLFLILILLLIGWFCFFPLEYKQFAKESVAAFLFLSNILFWMQNGYFTTTSEELFLLHTWSLSVEWQFYILYPIVLSFLLKYLRQNLFLYIFVFLLFFSLIISIYLALYSPSASFYLLHSRAWELLSGGMVYFLLNKYKFDKIKHLQLLGFLVILLSVIFLNKELSWPGFWAIIPVIGTMMFILSNNQNSYISESKTLTILGNSSYSIYLWHWPIFVFLNLQSLLSNKIIIIGGILFSILLGILSYLYIEQYFLKMKKTPLSKTKLFFFIFIALAIFISSVFIYYNKGINSNVRIINNDMRSIILNEYDKIHKNGLYKYYKSECDFYDYSTKKAKNKIEDDCTNSNKFKNSIFLWGDSHAQALSYGLRTEIEKNNVTTNFLQVATSGCPPSLRLNPFTSIIDNNCEKSNQFALSEILRLKPEIVIIAQSNHHDKTDWNEFSLHLQKLGVKNVVLVGPVPQYKPSLPVVYVRKAWQSDTSYIKDGLDSEIIKIDNFLQNKYSNSNNLIFLSPIHHLCNERGCNVILDNKNHKLLSVDYGHLSPEGSIKIGDYIINELINKESL